MAEKPRPQVEQSLGNLPQVVPAAESRVLNSYNTPGVSHIGGPARTNPMLQLSEALSTLDPALKQGTFIAAKEYGEEEYAKASAAFYGEQRDTWNQAVKNGQIPLGASPYAMRAFSRLTLNEAAQTYEAQVYQDWNTEAGAAARESNDPAVMRQFLQESQKRFIDTNLKSGDRSLHSPLDMAEIFSPKMDQANGNMMRRHAEHRVKEIERGLIESSSVSMQNAAVRNIANIQPNSSQAEREIWLKHAAEEVNNTLYNPDYGAVRNGLNATKANELLIETLTTQAMKTGNRDYLDVIPHVTNGKGASIGNTKVAQEKVLQAEEHITNQEMQKAHFDHWKDGLDFEARSRTHTETSWQKEEQRWSQEQKGWQEHDAKVATDEIENALTRRVYSGLRRIPSNSKEGQAAIDGAIREAEQIAPKYADNLRNLVATVTKQRTESAQSQSAKVRLRLDMDLDPLSFDIKRLQQATDNGVILGSEALALADDLDRLRQNASHPLIQQPEFRELLQDVKNGSLKGPDDIYSAEGALRVQSAVRQLRSSATSWIKQNPSGSPEQFMNDMHDAVPTILERVNKDYGKEQDKARQKEVQKGELIVEKTKQGVAQREKKQADEKAKQKAEQDKKDSIDTFNKTYKPTGQKSKENGREMLSDGKGNLASEQTITIHGVPEINGGGITNIPTIFNGKKVSDEEAIDIMKKNKGVDPDTGKKLKRYYSVTDATIAARERSARIGKEFKPKE